MLKNNDVLVIHQRGAPSHYLGLNEYCRRNSLDIVYLELDLIRQLALVFLLRLDVNILMKNVMGLCKVIYGGYKSHDIILGIAPFSRYILILPLIRSSKIYLHTSWPYWNDDYVPFDSKIFCRFWDYIIPLKLTGVFCVTKITKDSFTKRYPLFINNSWVVYHSIEDIWFTKDDRTPIKKYDFIYVGRIVSEKGVDKIIDIAKNLPMCNFVIVGDGPDLEGLSSLSPQNVVFVGRKNRSELREYFKTSKILLLPSIKVYNWVEAFGIVILEAISCGCKVVSSEHAGPQELRSIFKSIELCNELFFVDFILENHESLLIGDVLVPDNNLTLFSTVSISNRWEEGLLYV